MRIAAKLRGFHGFPEVEDALVDGALMLSVADDATVEDLLLQLAARYGSIFESKRPGGGTSLSRLYVLAGDQVVEDPRVQLADTLRPATEISIVLLRPLRGG